MTADLSVSKPPVAPAPDDGKGRLPSGKKGPARKRPPAKPAGTPATAASTPTAAADGKEPEHKLDMLV